VACGVVALRHEDVVVGAALEGLVQRDGLTHELFLNLAKTVKTRLEFKVMVGVSLGDGRDDGNVVALGADVVGGRDNGDVNVCRLCKYLSPENRLSA
jgi:hypothetical protein